MGPTAPTEVEFENRSHTKLAKACLRGVQTRGLRRIDTEDVVTIAFLFMNVTIPLLAPLVGGRRNFNLTEQEIQRNE